MTDFKPSPSTQPAPQPTRPPRRDASPTNLTRAEAQWRSQVLSVKGLEIDVDLTSAPDRQASGFLVTSTMTVTVHEACQGAWVDFLGEEVLGVRVDGAEARVSWDGARVVLEPLTAGTHTVEVRARGRYSTSGQGLHRFHDPVDGHTYLYTHFEPSDARRAWPCCDQPDLKAPVTLSVTHPAGWVVLGNGSVEHSLPVDGARAPQADGARAPQAEGSVAGPATQTVRTRMSTTHPLPSYLTALAAGPWHRVTRPWRSPERPGDPAVELSWSCRASLAEHLDGDELLDVTAAGMNLYDRTYGYPYPWGSYDSVLVPEYNIGAMENPGCVTFNEDAYLFRGPATAAQHGARANTIMHEMCHMWFGDLVTPRWWDDTWLKESFADHQGTWAQAEATPWRHAWAGFALGRKAWAYAEDARAATTHPIIATVDDVEAARQTFDGITYAKGAAVLKQLVAYLGQDVFTAAARTWFTEHAFGNGSLEEFLETLCAVSGRDVNAWARAWLGTSGPSVLTAQVEHDGERLERLSVRQEAVDPATGEVVLRPHRLYVGLYSFVPGPSGGGGEEAGGRDGEPGQGLDAAPELVRTHRFALTLDGPDLAEAEVAEAVGLAVPDLVTVNDEDLTYAVIRPDAASLATARTSLGRLRDPLARAVWWSSLDNLVRDALLEPGDYVSTVLTQAGDDTEPATLATLLDRSRHHALVYAAGSARAGALGMLVGEPAWSALAAAEAGSDAQLVRARAWIEAAGHAGVLEAAERAEAVERLRQVLAAWAGAPRPGVLEGLTLTDDLRWRTLVSLARLGAVDDADVDAALAADPSATGATKALLVRSAAPQAALKEALLQRAAADRSLSNDQLDALVSGYGAASHAGLTAPLTARYLDLLEQVWATTSQEMATRFVSGFFPAAGGEAEAALVDRWLAEHESAAPALRRLLLKGLDDLQRALRARRAWSAPSAPSA